MVPSFRNSENGSQFYYYKIEVFIATFDIYDSYTHFEEFRYDDLREARKSAFVRQSELINILEKQGMFFLPFAKQENFVFGKNACYSVILSLVIEDHLGEKEIVTLISSDEPEIDNSFWIESQILEQLRIR